LDNRDQARPVGVVESTIDIDICSKAALIRGNFRVQPLGSISWAARRWAADFKEQRVLQTRALIPAKRRKRGKEVSVCLGHFNVASKDVIARSASVECDVIRRICAALPV